MRHPSSRQLFEYWNERGGARLLPRLQDIEPEAIRSVLADTLLLSFAPSSGHPIRTAGTRVCALFGREMKGEAFLHVFSPHAEVSKLLSLVADAPVGAVGSAIQQPRSGTGTLLFEFLLLPLSIDGKGVASLLGAIVPDGPSGYQTRQAVGKLALGPYRFVGHRSCAQAAKVFIERPSMPRFVVYEGGKR